MGGIGGSPAVAHQTSLECGLAEEEGEGELLGFEAIERRIVGNIRNGSVVCAILLSFECEVGIGGERSIIDVRQHSTLQGKGDVAACRLLGIEEEVEGEEGESQGDDHYNCEYAFHCYLPVSRNFWVK